MCVPLLFYTFAHSNRRPYGSASLNVRSNCHFATDKSSIYIREPAKGGFRFPMLRMGIGVLKVQRFKKGMFIVIIYFIWYK